MEIQAKLCHNSSLCGEVGWEAVAITINIFGVIINILHLIALSRIANISGTAYLKVLQVMSVADIFSSCSNMSRKFCPFRHLFYQNSQVINAASSVLFDAPSVWRYYVLVVATIDRYTAICRPYKYNISFLTRYMTTCMLVPLMFVILSLSVRDFVFFDYVCLHTIAGPSSFLSGEGPSMFTSGLLSIPFLVTMVLSALIMAELYRMRRRSLNDQQRSITNAAKYILLLNVLFIICLSPAIMWTLYSAYGHGRAANSLGWVAVETFALYSIVNCILYGWMSKNYQQTVAKMFRISTRDVHPSVPEEITTVSNGGSQQTILRK